MRTPQLSGLKEPQMHSPDLTSTIVVGEASAPEGTRLYAIGDVHGCLDQLKRLHGIIEDDLTLRPVPAYQIIYLGDYVDRGPDSKGCIQFLIEKMATDPNVTCLKGNHEDKLRSFLKDPLGVSDSFLTYGGRELSLSYGVPPAPLMAADDAMITFRNALKTAIPAEHLTFMRALPTSHIVGDYMFVHAGIRPDIALNEQRDRDLMWIRTDFLFHSDPLNKVIIHGHTPNHNPEVKRNRINVDTLAYDTGNLTCVVLEGRKHLFLSTQR